MSILEAVLLGIIQGITEFLPVSSSAHLVLAQQLLNIQNNQTILFDVALHMGTLVAVFLVFRKDIRRVVLSLFGILQDLIHNLKLKFRHRHSMEEVPYRKILSTNYRNLAFLLVITTIPTAVIGWLMRDIAFLAFDSLLMPGVLFFITAVMLLVADMVPRGEKIPKNMKPGCTDRRYFSRFFRTAGNFQIRYRPVRMSSGRSRPQICSQIFHAHVRAGNHRRYDHGNHKGQRTAFGGTRTLYHSHPGFRYRRILYDPRHAPDRHQDQIKSFCFILCNHRYYFYCR